MTSARPLRHRPGFSLRSPGAGAEQLLVLGAQLASGLGNFAFSVVVARILTPPEFTMLRVFLALYLLLNVPAGSMSAGSALDPRMGLSARRRVLSLGVALALGVALTAVPVGALLRIPVPLVLVLALSFPAVGSRALLRGRMWGTGRFGRGAMSLLADVFVRLAAGTALAWAFGAVGGAFGVVAGGYASLAIVSERGAGPDPQPDADSATPRERGAAWWTTGAFFALAWMFNQDLLLANKLLPAGESARFAGVSTVGGTAAFATMAIPWLLLPRVARGDAGALRSALAVAGLAGAAAIGLVLLWPAQIASIVLGSRYASIAPLLPSYMLAMAIFGLARVLVAQRCAAGAAKQSLALTAGCAAVQAAAIGLFADDAAGVVTATLIATAALPVAVALAIARPRIAGVPAAARSLTASLRRLRHGPALAAAIAAAATLRLLFDRGLWVDEAITVATAEQSFPEMLQTLRTSDVHPPLHYAAVWTVIRVFGRTEMELRSISIISGILLVAVLYVLGREFFDHRTAAVAASLSAVCPLLIWYSQEARMYSVVMLLAATAVWAQIRAVRTHSWGWWTVYVLSTCAMLWTHYMTVFQVLVQQSAFLVIVLERRRAGDGRLLSQWLLSLAAVAVLVAPLVPFATDQLEAMRARQAAKVPSQTPLETGQSLAEGSLSIYALLANFVWALVGYHSDATMNKLVALWPLGMLPAITMLGRGRPSGGARLLCLAAIVPIAALYGIGFFFRNLFEVRYFATAVPLVVLLGARMITKCTTTTRSFALVLSAVLAALIVAGADQQQSAANPRIYDFRGAIQEIRQRSSGGKDVIVYRPQFLKHVVAYYAPALRSTYTANDIPLRRRAFVLASFLQKPNVSGSTGSLLADLEQRYQLIDRIDRAQVRVWVFEPDPPRSDRKEGSRGRN